MDLQFPYDSFSFFFFVAILLTLIHKWKRAKKLKLPPGPWKLPLIGSTHHLIIKSGGGSLPHHILRDLARKHGPLMHLQLGEVSAIVVSSQRTAKEVMKTHDLALANRPHLVAFEMITYNYTDIGLGQYGDYWRQMRRICVTELLSANNVRSLGSVRHAEGSRLVASIRAPTKVPVNLTHEITSYTSSMLCRAAFGNVCGSDDQETFVRLVKEASALGGGFGVVDLFPSWRFLGALSGAKSELLKIHNGMDAIFENIIDQHMEKLRSTSGTAGNDGGEDLIDILLRVKENGNLQFPITKNNIKAVIFDMFSGGTETSSTAVEWAMSEMMKNPDVMKKAQSEVRQAFKGKITVDENGVEGLKYLKLVIKETLRLHPPLPLLVPRECREVCEIDGYNIPEKTKVIVNAWAIGRDAEYWNNPECFKPERFEHNSIDFTGNHFEYVPFGAGRRMCPGILFGLANVELPLALLLYHFDWELPPGVTHLDMTETFGMSVSRKHNLLLVPTLYDPLE